MSSTVVLAGGQVHVHLSCESCSDTAWSHQQIATLAEMIAQRLATSTSDRAGTPLKPLIAESSASAARSETPSLGKNGPRTRTGCFTCRGKRVKCDEAKPVCTRCKRNPERQCVYPKTASSSPAPRSKPTAPPPSLSSSKIAMRRSQGSISRPSVRPQPHDLHPLVPFQGQDLVTLFLDGISFLAEPGLLNVRPTKPGARARSDRVLAKLWEAQMFISASGADARRSDHASLASALVSATRSLGAVKRAFATTKPTAAHEEMIRCSRQFAAEAAAVIVRVVQGTILNDPETVCILFELFLMRDCASGDPQWCKTHNLLVEYIVHCGGPQRLLENDRAALLGNSILEDHLVYLTVYDTFAALTTNVEPLMLAPGHTRWIEDVTCAQQVVHADFGFSLKILQSVAELATLLPHKPPGPRGGSSDSSVLDVANERYLRACQAMADELENETMATIYATTAPTRVQFGDLLIRHALICHLQRVGFERPRDDPRIQASAAAIIELLVEVSVRTGSMINLNYPIIVAAGLIDASEQERLQTVIDFTRLTSCLQEVYRMEEIVQECWRRANAGEDVRMADIWNRNSTMLIL